MVSAVLIPRALNGLYSFDETLPQDRRNTVSRTSKGENCGDRANALLRHDSAGIDSGHLSRAPTDEGNHAAFGMLGAVEIIGYTPTRFVII